MSAELEPINKKRLHEDIVSQIQQKIFSGDFQAGEKLPTERDLSQSFAVNRSTLREALKKLEILDLVEIRHGDGIYIKDYLRSGNLDLLKTLIQSNTASDLNILKNLLDIRRIITPEMAALAAEKRSEQDLKKMQQIISDKDISEQDKDYEFHHAIATASGNIFYIIVLNFLRDIFENYAFLYFSANENIRRSHKFQSDIYKALEEKDLIKAKNIMHNIMIYAEEKSLESYRKFLANSEVK